MMVCGPPVDPDPLVENSCINIIAHNNSIFGQVKIKTCIHVFRIALLPTSQDRENNKILHPVLKQADCLL